MDQATFNAYHHLVGPGEPASVVSLSHLTDEERDLFNLLQRNNWRVEQERLEVEWVTDVIKELLYHVNTTKTP